MTQGQVFMALPRGSNACALSHYPEILGFALAGASILCLLIPAGLG